MFGIIFGGFLEDALEDVWRIFRRVLDEIYMTF